jgi:hypothetical protein
MSNAGAWRVATSGRGEQLAGASARPRRARLARRAQRRQRRSGRGRGGAAAVQQRRQPAAAVDADSRTQGACACASRTTGPSTAAGGPGAAAQAAARLALGVRVVRSDLPPGAPRRTKTAPFAAVPSTTALQRPQSCARLSGRETVVRPVGGVRACAPRLACMAGRAAGGARARAVPSPLSGSTVSSWSCARLQRCLPPCPLGAQLCPQRQRRGGWRRARARGRAPLRRVVCPKRCVGTTVRFSSSPHLPRPAARTSRPTAHAAQLGGRAPTRTARGQPARRPRNQARRARAQRCTPLKRKSLASCARRSAAAPLLRRGARCVAWLGSAAAPHARRELAPLTPRLTARRRAARSRSAAATLAAATRRTTHAAPRTGVARRARAACAPPPARRGGGGARAGASGGAAQRRLLSCSFSARSLFAAQRCRARAAAHSGARRGASRGAAWAHGRASDAAVGGKPSAHTHTHGARLLFRAAASRRNAAPLPSLPPSLPPAARRRTPALAAAAAAAVDRPCARALASRGTKMRAGRPGLC